MWKNGSTAMITSSAPSWVGATVWAMLATRLWWVSMTPFDRPVVPDE